MKRRALGFAFRAHLSTILHSSIAVWFWLLSLAAVAHTYLFARRLHTKYQVQLLFQCCSGMACVHKAIRVAPCSTRLDEG